ncbi:alginate export family protein [Sporocytophaga sp.]|uniref:alginate export family protein n=1 Tax=Sporocytophaga sp. TaxID=2231183 RepID=UPI0025EC830A|nr:alginate export family protein [Sporocytophaga sp.]
MQRSNTRFEDGVANELRHSHGIRFWRSGGNFVYNFEAVWQWGKFGDEPIHAWTASADIGYVFRKLKSKPNINLRHDYISGDKKKGDGQLGTFNPLYPKGGYFAYNPQLGPANLIDLHPYATVRITKRIMIQADVVFNWRFSLQDGIYSGTGSFSMPGANSRKRYIGTIYQTCIEASISKFMTFNTGVQYFRTGKLINELVSNSKDGVFFNSRLDFKF